MKSVLLFIPVIVLSCTADCEKSAVIEKGSNPVFSIQPPLRQEQPETEIFSIDNSKDTLLITDHGSFIAIPAKCFQLENGNESATAVSVRFTEYSNTAEILLSGIPMQFIEKGDTQVFQSAGMCAVEAFSENQRLSLREGMPLSVGLRNQAQGNDYNLYFFDTLQGEWIEEQKNIPVTLSESIPVRPISEIEADTARIIRISVDNYANRPLHKMWHQSEFYLLSGERLRYADQDVWWYDVTVSETRTPDIFELNFQGVKDEKQYREKIRVQPVIDSAHMDAEMQAFREKMICYAREVLAVQKKIELDEAEGEALRKVIKEELRLDSLNFAAQVRTQQITDSMLQVERRIQDSLNAANGFLDGSNGNDEVMRVFSMNRLGIYNCDRFYNSGSTVLTHVRFQESGGRYRFTHSYLVNPTANAVLSPVVQRAESYTVSLGAGEYYFVGITEGKIYAAAVNRERTNDGSVVFLKEVDADELERLVTR